MTDVGLAGLTFLALMTLLGKGVGLRYQLLRVIGQVVGYLVNQGLSVGDSYPKTIPYYTRTIIWAPRPVQISCSQGNAAF
jgi:hypothetical protein